MNSKSKEGMKMKYGFSVYNNNRDAFSRARPVYSTWEAMLDYVPDHFKDKKVQIHLLESDTNEEEKNVYEGLARDIPLNEPEA